jgi:predicted TIM-barrel fold metal-dependent hydrolase
VRDALLDLVRTADVFVRNNRPQVMSKLGHWPDSFVKYVDSYGRSKVLFGTDFPVLDFKRTVDEIAALGFKLEVRLQLLRDNALTVFGIPE